MLEHDKDNAIRKSVF